MTDNDRKIGRIVKVKTYQALAELLPDTSSYVKSSYGGLYAIATVNSYVIIPIGSERVVGMVTELDMSEAPEAKSQNRQMLVLPNSRRTMWVSMVGTITQDSKTGNKRFDFGIRRYPELDNPVWFASEEDLDVIFEKKCIDLEDPERPKRLISIGKSPLFSDYDVQIDMDRFFGKHAAILGNTGSGKSCTVTAIINAVMQTPKGNGMPHAHFIIFDTNAEYEAAFTKATSDGNGAANFLYNRLVIKNEGNTPRGFWVPHWFMNGLDYQTFFRPGEGAQGPLLQRAIGVARANEQRKTFRMQILQIIENCVNTIDSILNTQGNAAYYGKKNIREQIQAIKTFLQKYRAEFTRLSLGSALDVYEKAFSSMEETVAGDGYADALVRECFLREGAKIRTTLQKDKDEEIETEISPVGIDTPSYFDFDKFVQNDIREEIQRESQNNPNLPNWVGTLLMRLEQARQDPRYNFLFKVPQFGDALASFLRLVLGVDPSHNFSKNGDGLLPWQNEYSKQHPEPPKQHQVTILDFSQLASGVLENVTALIGRLILEFMQRCPKRGAYPVVLVLEEAHRYIPTNAPLERQQRAREVFERIAKEGRKYGLSLVVASQRPSELSPTVLAQCNSFIVHRIQNPDDREYFRAVISGINRELLDQLPSLPQQHALVIGDCVTVPVQVRINDVDPKPNSRDPQFFAVWSNPNSKPPDFETICTSWECRNSEDTPSQSNSIPANGSTLEKGRNMPSP